MSVLTSKASHDGLFLKLSPVGWAGRYVFGSARRGLTIGFHLL